MCVGVWSRYWRGWGYACRCGWGVGVGVGEGVGVCVGIFVCGYLCLVMYKSPHFMLNFLFLFVNNNNLKYIHE